MDRPYIEAWYEPNGEIPRAEEKFIAAMMGHMGKDFTFEPVPA